MWKKSVSAFVLVLSSLSASAESAVPAHKQHIVIAPTCLTSYLSASHHVLARSQQLSLIAISQAGVEQLSLLRHKQATSCGGFRDVTATFEASSLQPLAFLNRQTASRKTLTQTTQTYTIKHSRLVTPLLAKLNPQNMWNNLSELSAFQTRSAVSDNGVKAAQWLKAHLLTIATEAGQQDVTAYEVKNTQWLYKQPSVVVKWGHSNKPAIVLGAHMDTLPTLYGKMPGADDDGSGSVTLLEVARVLMNSGIEFDRPIYFVWYSAEEMGLIGSQAVVADFAAKKIPVAAVIQFDMTGYAPHNSKDMWLLNDYVNPELTGFLRQLITEYVKRPVFETTCGYDCSDHASWYEAGYAAAAPAESAFDEDNKDIHTAEDTMDKLSLEHMTDYAKLGVAFAVELAKE